MSSISRRAVLQVVRWCLPALLLLFQVPAPVFTQEPGDNLPKTKAVLTEIYHDEMKAYSSYRFYAERAEEEGYPKIAALFRAITVSEMVHAQNMRHLLEGLGEEVVDEEIAVEVSTTRRNLKKAMDVELSEISETYPSYLERITPEDYLPAIEAVNYSWNSEKQHRENITKIRKSVGLFFGLVAKKIESAPAAYYVCTVCGSTVREISESTCSICAEPSSLSVKVPGDEALPEE